MRKIAAIIGNLLIVGGIAGLLLFHGEANQVASSASGAAPQYVAVEGLPQVEPITRLAIAAVALETEVVPAQLVQTSTGITWEVPPFKVGHAVQTAGAGEAGNAVLLGHVSSRSSGDVFKDLRRVRLGDKVEVFSEHSAFHYRVEAVRTVSRDDISVLDPTDSSVITLVTCTGAWLSNVQDYSERLIVRARLVNEPGL